MSSGLNLGRIKDAYVSKETYANKGKTISSFMYSSSILVNQLLLFLTSPCALKFTYLYKQILRMEMLPMTRQSSGPHIFS